MILSSELFLANFESSSKQYSIRKKNIFQNFTLQNE